MKSFFRYLPMILMTLLVSVSSIRMCISFLLEQDSLNVIVKYVLILSALLFVLFYFQNLRKALFFVSIIILFVVGNYLLFDSNREYIIQTIGDTWVYLVAVFLCGYVITKEDLVKALTLGSAIILFCCILLLRSPLYYEILTEKEYGGVGAVYSSMLFIPAVVFAFSYKWKGNVWYLLPSIVSALLIAFLGGKRMVLICCILAVIYVLFNGINKQRLTKCLLLLFFFLCILLIVMPFFSKYMFESYGIDVYSIRILNFLTSNDVSHDGRTTIYSSLFENIFTFEGLFVGRGMNGDMVISSDHQYSHNLFLELIVEFGLILGIAIIVVLFLLLRKVVEKKTEFNQILTLMLFLCFLPLMVSGTFWNYAFFWLSIAICYRVLTNKHSNKEIICSPN